jgi:SAM-dependent methyltransferase
MGDTVRNAAFAKALKAVIKPGETVVADVGSGTGFLSFLASKLGAKECDLYEVSPDLLALSKALAKENGVTNCRFVGEYSTEVRKPRKADVVVSETLGNYALEEGMLETMNDAVARFLAPGGIVIPSALRQFVVPVVTDRLWTELNLWTRVGHGLTFGAAEKKTLQNVYVREIREADLLPASAKEWDRVDFRRKDNASVRDGEVAWKPAKGVTVYGFCVFWETDLVPDVTLSTSPSAPATHWQQLYLPVLEPVTVPSGATLHFSIRSDTRPEIKVNLEWRVAVADATGKKIATQALDMRKG